MHALLKAIMLVWLMVWALPGQAQTPLSLDVIHSHFVGTWSGVNHDFTKKPPVTNSVTIVITEDKKHDRLHFDYTYGTKGHDHLERFLDFDIPHSTLVFQWKHDDKQPAQLSDFEEFARTGYGSFSVSMTNVERGARRFYIGVFHIEPDTFRYEWKVSKNGATFVDNGDWTLTRQAATP